MSQKRSDTRQVLHRTPSGFHNPTSILSDRVPSQSSTRWNLHGTGWIWMFHFSINVADPGKENIFCTAEITLHVEKFIFCIIIFCKTDLILFQKRSAIKFSPDIRKCPGGKEAAKLKFLRISMISGKRCMADCRQYFAVPESRIIGNYNIRICLLCHTDITLHDDASGR